MFETERDVALAVVERACGICEAVRSEMVEGFTLDKADRSPVTVADFSAQALVSEVLRERFPNDPLVAEEDANTLSREENVSLRQAVVRHVRAAAQGMDDEVILAAIARGDYSGGPDGRFWALDPIDGTKGFLRGGQYAIALALVIDGQVAVGVLGCPRLPCAGDVGCLFAAVRRQGTMMQPLGAHKQAPVHVSDLADLSQARMCEPLESAHAAHGVSARVAQLLGITAPPVRMDSQCKYGMVARGHVELYLRAPSSGTYQERIWDHAAGSLIVSEAGGVVTDFGGQPLDFGRGRTLSANHGIIATNGLLHARAVEAARQAIGGG